MNEIADMIVALSAAGALVMSILTFIRQGKTIAKVVEIEAHTNGLVKAIEQGAYDRGVSDEQAGDAKPKAQAP